MAARARLAPSLHPSASLLTVGACAVASQQHQLGEHEPLFRQRAVTGEDLAEVLEPDRHGFSVEQKLGWLGVQKQDEACTFAAVLATLSDPQ